MPFCILFWILVVLSLFIIIFPCFMTLCCFRGSRSVNPLWNCSKRLAWLTPASVAFSSFLDQLSLRWSLLPSLFCWLVLSSQRWLLGRSALSCLPARSLIKRSLGVLAAECVRWAGDRVNNNFTSECEQCLAPQWVQHWSITDVLSAPPQSPGSTFSYSTH